MATYFRPTDREAKIGINTGLIFYIIKHENKNVNVIKMTLKNTTV